MVLYKNMTESPLVFDNSVIVNNENNYSLTITLTAIDAWKDKVTFRENNFILNSGERKEVFYTINLEKEGVYEGDIIVTFKNDIENNEVSLAQRLVVAVKAEKKSSFLIILGITGIILAMLVLTIFIKLKIRRKHEK
jgi:hypothetical protein